MKKIGDIMTISEVSEELNISQDTLRYYEKLGIIPSVKRNKNGMRNYSDDDCAWIKFAKNMRNAGVGITALQEYVKLFNIDEEKTEEKRIKILIEERDKLKIQFENIKESLELIEYKINNFSKINKIK